MHIVIDISEDDYRKVKDGRASVSMMLKAIRNGTPRETVTEFADRCRECGKMRKDNKIRAEIDRQKKWLLRAGYNTYNVDIAFDAIKAVIAESEG